MTIEGLLEKLLKETDAQVSLDSKWMYFSEDTDEWIVLQREPYARKNTTLYRGINLDDALNIMKE